MESKIITLEENKTIKSTELVDIINQFRRLESETVGKDFKELAHYDFYKKISKEIGVLNSMGINHGNISVDEYVDKKGEKRPCYKLNRDGMLQMLNSESVLVRYKTIEYIDKLENQVKQIQPLEVLKLMCDKIDSLENQIQELKQLSLPKPRQPKPDTVSCEEVLDIIKKVLPISVVRTYSNEMAINKDIVYSELDRRGIKKSAFNRRLSKMNKGSISKVITIKGHSIRCMVIKNNLIL